MNVNTMPDVQSCTYVVPDFVGIYVTAGLYADSDREQLGSDQLLDTGDNW